MIFLVVTENSYGCCVSSEVLYIVYDHGGEVDGSNTAFCARKH